jgi:hypothetical protein
VGHAFVSFQYQHYRNFFLDEFERNPKGFVYNGSVLKFAPAASPVDVNWKNLRVGLYEKERMQLNSYFITLLILLVEYVLLFLLHLLLYHAHSLSEIFSSFSDPNQAQFSSTAHPWVFAVGASVVIVLANSVLKKTISSLVGAERHKTRVNETTTYMNKSVLAQFVSSCLSLFLLDLLLGSHRDLHFYANVFIAISSAVELLYQLVLPSWVGREVRRWWRYRGKGAEEAVGKFQCQLNKEFEYPEY